MTEQEIDAMVKAYVDNMPDMVLNSNGIMNWRVFFNEVARKVAGAAYKDGINAVQEQMMKDAINAEVFLTVFGDATLTFDNTKTNLKLNDKVKLIIIKEEQL